MVQEFQILRCFSCETFQVDQVKKSTNKWLCKVCHLKQSTKQVFFKGSGKECRLKVQSLNFQRGERNWAVQESVVTGSYENCQMEDSVDHNESQTETYSNPSHTVKSETYQVGSRWTNFVDKNEEDEITDEEAEASYSHVTTERRFFEESRRKQRVTHIKAKRNEAKPYYRTNKAQRSFKGSYNNVDYPTEQNVTDFENVQPLVKRNNPSQKHKEKHNIQCNDGQVSKWGQFLNMDNNVESDFSSEDDNFVHLVPTA